LRYFVETPEVLMNVHISYRLHKTPAVEKDIQHQVEKLRKRLQVFRPELIHLKGMIEEISAREGTSVSLNLRLPSGRSSHKWPRRRNEASARRNISIPFEQTLAAVFPARVSAEDVRSYVNVNLSRLERFVEREIYFREASDLVALDSISKEEVIDETIAAALGDGGDGTENEKPERMALEPWLYRLAMKALDELSRPEGTSGGAIRLEASARKPNVKASDEPELQFHQPDEAITEETIIADDRVATPEQIVGSDEVMSLIASALQDVSPPHREAFILHVIEGFGVDEISAITGSSPDLVLSSISAARDHLRKSPGLVRQFKGRFPITGTA
jgi:DNA-directed RNA polymerase specialized sigma24 family protein